LKFITKYIIFLLLLSCSFFGFSQQITFQQSDNRTIILTFEPSALQTQNVIIGNDTFVRLISRGAGTTSIIGNPALPVFQRQILSQSAAIEMIDVISVTEEKTYLKHKVLPFNLTQTRENDILRNNFTINSLTYSTDSLLPAVFFETGSEYYYAGNPQFDIRFYPLQYNPVTRQIVVIKKAVIRISFKSPTFKSVDGQSGNSFSNQLLNSNALKLNGNTGSGSLPPTLLIVTHASLYDQAKEFADWKMKMGIKTIILKTSDISANPDADQIKARIIQIHDTFSFDHLLFIGDVSLIPGFYGIGNSLDDHEYSTLQGSGFLPDIAIGRFPVFTATDTKMELQKSMNYERHPDVSTGNDWFRKATVAASDEQLDNSHGINMGKFFRNAGFDSIDDFRARIGSLRSDFLQKAFTNGRSWVFFIGHGEPTYWLVSGNYSTGTLNTLNNNGMLPVIVSVACSNANLDNPTDCLGEKWMSLGEKRGAVSFIGATALTEFFYSDTLGEYSVFGYFNRSALTIGAALNYGKMQMYNSFQGGTGSITEETMQQFLLMGDPTLMPWTNIPVLIQSDLKKHRKPVQQSINLKVTASGDPVSGALVCLSTKNFTYYQATYSDSLGNVSFPVNPDSNSTYYLTITGYNLAPIEDSISFDGVNSLPELYYNANISIYPNPVNDFCTISSHSAGKLINSIDIMDLNGRIITSYNNIHSYSFSFGRDELLSGIYILRITDISGMSQIRRIAVN